MQAEIFSHEHLIGTCELRVLDARQGRVGGVIERHENFAEIQHKLQDINSGMPLRHDMNMTALRVNVMLNNGYYLFPSRGYKIIDKSSYDADGQIIEDLIKFQANGLFDNVVRDFINAPQHVKNRKPAPNWMPLGWSKITHRLKILLEDSLLENIGVNYSDEIPLVLPAGAHPLAKFRFCAQAADEVTEDVLFAVHNRENLAVKYIQIHLPWIDRLAAAAPADFNPQVAYFPSLVSFHHSVMQKRPRSSNRRRLAPGSQD